MTELSIDRAALLGFLGYGNPKADVVFIGMEEGLSEPPSLADQLAIRSKFPQIIDLHESAASYPDKYLSGDRPPIQHTWSTMIHVLLALEGNEHPSVEDVREYQRNRLGRTGEAAALLELMPLPAHHTGEWPYAELFPQFADRGEYMRLLLETRLARLREHLSYGPKLVVAYGKGYWDYYKALYPGVTGWASRDPFCFASAGDTKVILSPHFASRQMNGEMRALLDISLDR